MTVHRVRRGLDLPLAGAPEPVTEDAAPGNRIALLGADLPGLMPRLAVRVGDRVLRGQQLLHDRRRPEIRVTSPVAGTVEAIHQGPRRALISVVIKPADDDEQVTFEAPADAVRDRLLESGLWAALRTRPFSRIPDPQSPKPASIFVTATDTQPLAPPIDLLLAGRLDDLERGLRALRGLCEGPVLLCKPHLLHLPMDHVAEVETHAFEGPHPAGNVGLHMHLLAPAGRHQQHWHLGLQDVLAVGALMGRGELDVRRTLSLAGPQVLRPRLLRTRLGASLDQLTAGELRPGESRVISGSVLAGRRAEGPVHGYLGRFHQQVSVLAEDRARRVLGWLAPGLRSHSVVPAFLSRWLPRRPLPLSTTTHGQRRHMVPIGVYEAVMPFDVVPTYLLRALLAGDLEQAEALGCLELDEEDLALCTYACPSKIDYGQALRRVLDRLEAEG